MAGRDPRRSTTREERPGCSVADVPAEVRKPELIEEARRIDQDLRNRTAERDKLLRAVSNGGPASSVLLGRLSVVDDEMKRLADRAAEVRDALVTLQSGEIDEEDVANALTGFDPIWEELFPRERARLLLLLIEAVIYDGQEGTIQIRFRPNGLRAVAEGRTR